MKEVPSNTSNVLSAFVPGGTLQRTPGRGETAKTTPKAQNALRVYCIV